VNCIATLPEIIATGSSDGTVKIFILDKSSNQFTFSQTLKISPLYPLTLSLRSTINGILLAIGGSSPHVHIYASSKDTFEFTRIAILKGHEDWIRGLDFTTLQNDIYLASASQDRYIRLWKFSLSNPPSSTTNDTDELFLSQSSITVTNES